MKLNSEHFKAAIRQAAVGYDGQVGLRKKIEHEGENTGHAIEHHVAAYFESIGGRVYHLPRGFSVEDRPLHVDQMIDLRGQERALLVEVKTMPQLRAVPTQNVDQWLQLPLPVVLATTDRNRVLFAPVLARPTNLRLFSRFQPTLTTSLKAVASEMSLEELCAYSDLWTRRNDASPIDLVVSPIVCALPHHPGSPLPLSEVARMLDQALVEKSHEMDQVSQEAAAQMVRSLVPLELRAPCVEDHIRHVVRTLLQEVSRRPKRLRFLPDTLRVLSYDVAGCAHQSIPLTLEQTSGVAALLSGLSGELILPRLTAMLQARDLQDVRLANWLLRNLWKAPQVSSAVLEALDERLQQHLDRMNASPWVKHVTTDLALTMLHFEPGHREARDILVSVSNNVPDESVRILLNYYGGAGAVFERMKLVKMRRDQPDGVREFESALHRKAEGAIRTFS